MEKRFSLGLDFGSLSCRAVVADVRDGSVTGSASFAYPHAVMDRALPCGTPLPPGTALQHPGDYLDALAHAVPEALAAAGISPSELCGIGVDFTACTMLPVTADGTPLCFLPGFTAEPHAYVKMWKHHSAQPQADRINALAAARGEAWLARMGGRASSEWMLPKILETLENAPAVYDAAFRFLEAGDWIVWMLTGRESHGLPCAGYKAFWDPASCRYPDNSFFTALDARLDGLAGTKLSACILPAGARAGETDEAGARRAALVPGIPVAAANPDGHVAYAALGKAEPGDMLLVLGTSGSYFVTSDSFRPVPGICGAVYGGVLPGLWGYESGQCCFGDHFDWFVQNCVPASYEKEAAARNMNLHALLRERAARLRPGECGLLALDWWNGNRSVLDDSDLSGVLFGLTLRTRPEDIYRALLEAVAFGLRVILDTHSGAGIPVHTLLAAGGIAHKDPLLMQILADVTGRPIRVAASREAPALGSAIFAAAAGGAYSGVAEAAARMGRTLPGGYTPREDAHAVYDLLYADYRRLHDTFGRGGNDVLKRLSALAASPSDPR